MGSIMNGMAVSGGALPFGGTFFIFSDYERPAVRLAALQRAKVAFVWSHDSVGLGEDGPTHQPIEHLMAMRAMPGLCLIRPADANEVPHAWRVHINGTGPTAIVLTRQNVPVLEATAARAPEGVPRGAYTLVDESGGLDLVLIGTGSEVHLCVDAREQLEADGLSVRVVSMPSWDLFAEQPDEYRDQVLPPGVPTLAVEAGGSLRGGGYAPDALPLAPFCAPAPGRRRPPPAPPPPRRPGPAPWTTSATPPTCSAPPPTHGKVTTASCGGRSRPPSRTRPPPRSSRSTGCTARPPAPTCS